jgi:BirA family biotin operon repressor/biotin-[acetyl-CoA-carboxylase] ligase
VNLFREKTLRRIAFETIDSTQLWAKHNRAFLNPDEFTIITTNEQTAGVGQFKRPWISPKDMNVCATFVFTLAKPCSFLTHLAQMLSLSCVTVLKGKGFAPQIKKPNDLLLAKRKVCGVLCDVSEQDDRYDIFLGVGINVNTPADILDTIDQPATSLYQISGRKWDIEDLLQLLIAQFLQDMDQLQEEGFVSFQEAYSSNLSGGEGTSYGKDYSQHLS